MKILQLVPRFPFPMDDGGKIGIANIYKQFSLQGNQVHLISLNHINLRNEDIQEARKYGKVDIIEFDTKNKPLKILKYFLKNESLYIEKNYSELILNQILELIEGSDYDIIHCDHTSMAKIGLKLREKLKIPVGLRLHNIEYLIWQRYYQNSGNFIKKVFLRQQYKRLMEKESEFIDNVDIAFPITEEDKSIAQDITLNSNLVVSTAGVDLNYWKSDINVKKIPFSLVIATTFNWVHNVNGLRWFIKEVLPIIKKKYPEVTINIIGKNIPDEFSGIQNVNIIGYVNDIRGELNKYQVYIAPLFVGGGIRIKILEALSLGLPVVCTDISAEGIKATENEGLFINNSASSTSEAIIKLFENQSMMDSIKIRSHKFISDYHSWEKNVKIMIDEYQKLLISKNI